MVRFLSSLVVSFIQVPFSVYKVIRWAQSLPACLPPSLPASIPVVSFDSETLLCFHRSHTFYDVLRSFHCTTRPLRPACLPLLHSLPLPTKWCTLKTTMFIPEYLQAPSFTSRSQLFLSPKSQTCSQYIAIQVRSLLSRNDFCSPRVPPVPRFLFSFPAFTSLLDLEWISELKGVNFSTFMYLYPL